MRNWMMLIVLACVFLAGCSNVANEGVEVPVIEKETPVIKEEAPVNEENVPSKETQEAYIQKLDDVEASLADLQHLQDEGTTVSMTEAANETYKRWDIALNEIYEELKQLRSASEMAELKEEQLQWITYRDETAKERSLQFEGGSMEALEHMSSLAQITKERCYELVQELVQ